MNQDRNEEIFTVHKASVYVPISTEAALDYGLITEEQARAQGWTPTPRPPVRWYVRLRWRLQSWRARAAARVCRLIAGYEMDHRDDD